MEEERLLQLTEAVIAWYAENGRSLPWRSDRSPYHSWIAEIMLQQTRIEAVIPYYERFLREVPDIAALAVISDDRLMKLWEGLGYYSRARNLKKAAVRLMAEYDGKLPETAAELKKLPGIGDYTAGAVASVSFGQPEPAVDGNVLRVMSRFAASEEDVLSPSVRKHVSESLRAVYPSGRRAGQLTEGLMELGELLCLPGGNPKCSLCPLAEQCLAHRRGEEGRFPVRGQKKPRRLERRAVFLLHSEGRFAIRKREERGLLAGLWEFPNLEVRGDVNLHDLDPQPMLQAFGIEESEIRLVSHCADAKHLFTHVEWEMSAFLAELEGPCGDFVWKTPEEIFSDYPLPGAFHPFRELIRQPLPLPLPE